MRPQLDRAGHLGIVSLAVGADEHAATCAGWDGARLSREIQGDGEPSPGTCALVDAEKCTPGAYE